MVFSQKEVDTGQVTMCASFGVAISRRMDQHFKTAEYYKVIGRNQASDLICHVLDFFLIRSHCVKRWPPEVTHKICLLRKSTEPDRG